MTKDELKAGIQEAAQPYEAKVEIYDYEAKLRTRIVDKSGRTVWQIEDQPVDTMLGQPSLAEDLFALVREVVAKYKP